jgi:hypothetical protein
MILKSQSNEQLRMMKRMIFVAILVKVTDEEVDNTLERSHSSIRENSRSRLIYN